MTHGEGGGATENEVDGVTHGEADGPTEDEADGVTNDKTLELIDKVADSEYYFSRY